MADLLGIDRRNNKSNEDYQKLQMGIIPNIRVKRINGTLKNNENDNSIWNVEKYKFLLDSPFPISDECCDIIKKKPTALFEKETGLRPILGTTCAESKLRTQKWLKEGCNGFYNKRPESKPLSFWTEQDILLYIKTRGLEIASVYGDIVEDLDQTDDVAGQLTWSDVGMTELELFDAKRPPLKTTGCSRTGCMFCLFGCHLEKPGEGRFERLKETHPKQYEYIMRPTSEGGLGMKEVVDWLNENGGFDIRY